jgi:acyl-CoA thioester hydrolase
MSETTNVVTKEPSTTNHLPFIAESRLRVRFAETDAQGVAYHANYIVWFEVGRGDYCREVGYPYSQIERDGYGFMVTELGITYRSPSRYDDELLLRTWIEKVGRASCIFGYQLYNETTNKLCVEGMTKHAAVAPSGKIVRFSPRLYDIMITRAGRGPSQFMLSEIKEKYVK